MNVLTASGKLKNVRVFTNTYGTLVVAQLTQKNGMERAKFTIPIAAVNPDVIRTLEALAESADDKGYTPEVVINGQLDTKFDLRRDVPLQDRKSPMTRIMIDSVELV